MTWRQTERSWPTKKTLRIILLILILCLAARNVISEIMNIQSDDNIEMRNLHDPISGDGPNLYMQSQDILTRQNTISEAENKIPHQEPVLTLMTQTALTRDDEFRLIMNREQEMMPLKA